MQTGTKVIIAAIAGALAGTVTGLLVAPASGKETREKLGERTDEVLDYLNDFAEKLKAQKDELVETAKQKAQKA